MHLIHNESDMITSLLLRFDYVRESLVEPKVIQQWSLRKSLSICSFLRGSIALKIHDAIAPFRPPIISLPNVNNYFISMG
jgi:hypothetical protein